jgi:hypothetical protein
VLLLVVLLLVVLLLVVLLLVVLLLAVLLLVVLLLVVLLVTSPSSLGCEEKSLRRDTFKITIWKSGLIKLR